MRIIIVGASGLIGRNLFTKAKSIYQKVIGTFYAHERDGLLGYDMRTQRLGSIIPDLGPEDAVFLLSAYTNVSWIYSHQHEAGMLNVQATKRLIDEIAEAGARIIFMSSVEVFDGEKGNYDENSLPNPLTAYGRMKYEIEQYLSNKTCNSCVIRTGWNVAWDLESPCVVKLTYQALLGPNAQMAKDNIFSIIDVEDTVEGLIRVLKRPEIRVCHLVSKPAVVRTQLASMIMQHSKYKDSMSFETVSFSQIPFAEKRSRDTHLDNALAVSALSMHFRSPESIIRRKVDLLERAPLNIRC